MANYKRNMKNGDIIIWNDSTKESVWITNGVHVLAVMDGPSGDGMEVFVPFVLYDVEDYSDMADIALLLDMDETDAEFLFDRAEEHMDDIEDYLRFLEDEGFIYSFDTDPDPATYTEVLLNMLKYGSKEIK